MQLKSKCCLLIVLLAALLPLSMATAGTVIEGGDVSGTWTSGSQPYTVQGDIVIQSSETLVIEPGVTVYFNGHYSLTVYGVLLAEGAMDIEDGEDAAIEDVDWIVFTQFPQDSIYDSDRWKGIRFDGSDPGSVIKYAIIEESFAQGDWPYTNGGGLYIFGSSPRIENSIIRNCRAEHFGGGVYLWSSSSIFRNNLIAHNMSGYAGGGISLDVSNIELRNLTIVDNYTLGDSVGRPRGNGIFFGTDAAPFIRSTIFWENLWDDEDGDDDIRDQGYFSKSTEPTDIRYCILSSGSADIERFIWNSGFYPDDEIYYTLTDSSTGVDNGDVFDTRYSNEPIPNGSKMNMGAYGGTILANRSRAVVSPIHPASQDYSHYNFYMPIIRVLDTTSTPVGIANIGHGQLYVYFDSLEFVPPDTGEDFSDRFTITPFARKDIASDSFDVFEVVYHPRHDDALAYITRIDTAGSGDTTYATRYMDVNLLMKTNGGNALVSIRGTAVRPVIEVSVDSLEFGTVNLGNPRSMSFIIKNNGDTVLDLIRLPITYTNHFHLETEGARTLINPGSGRVYEITCDPRNYVGDLLDSLQIRNNHQMKHIQLSGFSKGPILRPEILVDEEWERAHDRDVLDYLFVDLDSTRTLNVVLHNDGNDFLQVDSVISSNPDFYAVLPGTMTFPATIATEDDLDSLVLGIRFDPRTVVLYTDSIEIVTSYVTPDTTISNTLILYVQGRGTTGGVYFAGAIPNPSFGIPEVWGEDDETVYVCAGPTWIPTGSKLTILAGVEVQFESDGSNDNLVVEGTLEVLGTEYDTVYFKPQPSDSLYYHGGIYFFAADSRSRMQWAVVDSASAFQGGGIKVHNCSPSFYHVTVRNCVSEYDGGGIWVYQSAPSIIRCTFVNNSAGSYGGGVMLWGSEPEFHNNIVKNNQADFGGGIMLLSYADPVIANTLIMGNTARFAGGGMFVWDHSSPVLLNTVFYANDADYEAQAIRAQMRSNPILRNSVILGHGGDVISHGEGGNLIMRYSVVEGIDDPENYVFDADPEDLFVDPDNGDFHPAAESDLIDAGDPASRYEDYSFPPSKGTSLADIGLYGGIYAGIWDGAAPIRLTFFTNIANPRTLKMVVNVIGDIDDDDDPILEVETYQETTDLELTEVSESAGVYFGSYSVDESTYLIATVKANDGEFRFRRSLHVAVYKPAVGGTLSDPEGARLILPPFAIPQEVLITGEPDHGAALPDSVPLAEPAGARWVISSQIDSWSLPAELILPYDPAVVRAGTENDLAVWRRIDDEWERLESYVNPSNHTIHTTASGTGTYVVVFEGGSDASTLLPVKSELGVNYPNPFNPSTTVPFNIVDAGIVDLRIYNILGQEVIRLAEGWYTAGRHLAVWHGSDNFGNDVASGIYIYRFRVSPANGGEKVVHSRKMVLMR